jgi:hypothetical protein
MTRARDIANLVDANGDIVAGALDNVPAADVVNDTTPQLGGNLESNGNDVVFADNDKAIFGAGSDLQIYHDGSNSIIAEASVGSLKIQGSDLYLTDDDGTNMLYAANNGGVTLYQGGGAKLATTSTGIDVSGNVVVDSEGGSATTDLRQGSAKAWVSVNMSSFGTRASFNTTSVTDRGTGRLEMNTTNAFSAVHEWSAQATSGASSYNSSYYPDNATTSKIGMRVRNDALNYLDTSYNMLTVVGDLA